MQLFTCYFTKWWS